MTADCTGSKVTVGGGYITSNVSDPAGIVITTSQATDANTWTATGVVDNSGTGDQSYSLAAFVICVDPA